MDEQTTIRLRVVTGYLVVGLALFGLLGTELFWIFTRQGVSLPDKTSAVLAIIGLYGLGVGFFTSSPALEAFRSDASNLTSTNIVDFVTANLIFMSFIMFIVSLGLASRGESGAPHWLRFLGGLLWLALFPVVIAYSVIHLLIVVPVTYVPNLLASALVTAIAYSGGDVEMVANQDDEEVGRASIKNIVKHNEMAAKGFFMGVPAVVVAFLGKVLGPVLGG